MKAELAYLLYSKKVFRPDLFEIKRLIVRCLSDKITNLADEVLGPVLLKFSATGQFVQKQIQVSLKWFLFSICRKHPLKKPQLSSALRFGYSHV